MKKKLLPNLICPACLPGEHRLLAEITREHEEDIIEGTLRCPQCAMAFPVESGIAFLDPGRSHTPTDNKYELEEVVSSYMWSHYADLFNDEQASDAYKKWSGQMASHPGISVDLGGAVGRFTFEMSSKCALSVGIDSSVAFIKAARELMNNRQMNVHLKEEGFLTREVTVRLPEEWKSDRVEFIVADAGKIPFRSESVSSCASLNLVDKVATPIQHLKEMNRVTRKTEAQFLLSDPFSWSKEAADTVDWLGGTKDGPFAGKGLDNIKDLLKDAENGLTPAWRVNNSGHIWWKIRTHANHYELIRSCFVKASR